LPCSSAPRHEEGHEERDQLQDEEPGVEVERVARQPELARRRVDDADHQGAEQDAEDDEPR
jgi:hypothetical protein